ncbi:MFS transporter [Burkholderia plantarii]|uniref:MFS transporter n=1 Tax=Burkholderia plantarii TaxID=41899 RepID=UPI0006D88F3A|nr:MFS transporter [Burkholderia plantarii]ALK32779.1 D-galactonate transporter [Burkholderia plantarii]WLE61859.1 MFS transporter [Burkholderia plantarii]GLZ23258.1 putative glucarate transporter [Burkholderia plantarii]
MEATRTANPATTVKRTAVRYWILLMIFVVTTLNYADRATLSITGTSMRKEFGIDAVQMGYIFSSFSWAYVLAQLPSGWLLDRFGARRVYAGSIFLWSLFTLLQSTIGFAGSATLAVAALFVLRFAVGIAEAPAFPANAKVVASWFPTSERGTASAIFNAAQYFAAVLFTPLMAWLTHAFSWHQVYLWLGLAGMALALLWMRVVRSPADHPGVNQAEREHIEQGGGVIETSGATPAGGAPERLAGWFYVRQLLGNRMLIGVYLGQYCINVLTYFFLTWFPIYLVQARGMSILKAGVLASLPAICGFLGGVLGGMLSDGMIRRGVSLTRARKIPIIGGMLLSMAIIGCNYVDSAALVIALMALSFFGKGIGSLGWAVVADTAPKEAIGLSGSLFNMFGNAAGIVTPIVIGYLVGASGSFNGALLFVGLNALVTVLCYLVIVKDITRVTLRKAPGR